MGLAVREFALDGGIGGHDFVVAPAVDAEAEGWLDVSFFGGGEEMFESLAALIVYGADDVDGPAVGREIAPDVDHVVAGVTLHIHAANDAVDALVVELGGGPIFQRQGGETHVV